MATAAEYLAAAERAKAAGDTAAEARLRAAAAAVPAQEAAPDAARYRAAAERARAAGDEAAAARLIAAADALGSAATPAPAPVMAQLPPRADAPGAGPTPPRPDTWTDTASGMMEGPLAAAGAFAGGLSGGPSPSRDFLANDPMTAGLPSPLLTALGGVGDLAGTALAGLGAGLAGGIGLASELVPGQDARNERRLADDVLGMSMFAVPELAGVSSVPVRIGTTAAGFADDGARMGAGVADDAARAGASVADDAARVGATSADDAARAAMGKGAAGRAYTQDQINALAAKAGSNGMGAVKAREELARAAKVNIKAKEAADRLGIDLPADVFSDDEMVRASAGLTRSKVASEAEGAWRNTYAAVRDKADDLMKSIDGSADIASVSEKVKTAIQGTRNELKATAAKLYGEIDDAVPKGTRIAPDNTVKALNGVIGDMGGPEGLTAAERGLFDLVTGKDPITYGRLMREKSLIGKAIERGAGPYGDADMASLKRLYGALSDDQMLAVETVGGTDLRAKLRSANQLTAKQKGLEARIVNSFGKDIEGSIANKLRTAITQGSKGDIANLNRILRTIPEDMRREVMATAIRSVSSSARSSQPGFGLPEFAKAWAGIKANKPVYNQIGTAIGADGMKMLDDLSVVAERVNQASARVLTTGKANQAGFDASGLVGRVLQTTSGQRAARGAGAAVGGVTGGPLGAAAGADLAATLVSGKSDGILAAGRLFSSPEFTQAAVEAAQGAVTPATRSSLLRSRPFQSWARVTKVADPDAWLGDVLRDAGAPVGQAAATEAANANASPYERLWQKYGGTE